MLNTSPGFGLSILLVTYNHESYIDRALESLFNQDFSGTIELVVADDASTDSTLARIRTYEGVDSRFSFKYLSCDTNVGITKNYQRGFGACTGQYVAVLEGDDYWISPRKLSRQVEFLSEHWECDLCSVNYFIFYEANASFVERTPIGAGHRLLGARELIMDNLVGNFSTCMYRKTALDRLPVDLFEVKSYDWIVNICVASSSLIGFIEEPMSVYRVHSSGAWSNFAHIEKLQLQLSLIPTYDGITRQMYHAEFTRLEHDLRSVIILARGEQLAGNMVRPALLSLTRLRMFMPPIVITIFQALMPPILTRLLLKIARRGRT
ncbi:MULTISPECIES: glycosyltransferase [unclassified Pseudomonas]|jgi:glycosyltransferase involved in cell wall biosynthesis|uniref:glycosyltransferase n=1 Tax=Pseudomonas sp. A-R-26 TaxID=2832404 RepID=UPI001CC12806|nr:glycosyltransferase [Pseudomonas sp. A-R-26]